MPIRDHTCFLEPATGAHLWRYMDVPRFLALLSSRSLWFCNLETLAKEDPFEGILPQANYRHRNWETLEDVPEADLEQIAMGDYGVGDDLLRKVKRAAEIRDLRIRQAFAHRRTKFASCWHLAETESAAMWSIYSRLGEGLAVVTTTERLKAAFAAATPEIYCGIVRYLNYETDEVSTDNGFTPTLCKRVSFTHEAEARLIVWDTNLSHRQVTAQDLASLGPVLAAHLAAQGGVIGRSEEEIEALVVPPGVAVPCDIDPLIESICLAPRTPPWLVDAIVKLAEQYGLGDRVRKSTLLDEPAR